MTKGKQRHETERWDGVHCTLALERPARGVAVLRIKGHDIGEFGEAPMRALERCFAEDGAVALFVDARETDGASLDVSGAWAQWLGRNRAGCSAISLLAGSRFVEITAEFVRRFAALHATMRVYTDAAAFDRAVAEAIARGRAAG